LSDLSPLQLALTAATNLRRSGLLLVRLLLMQHFLATAALFFGNAAIFARLDIHRSLIQQKSKRTLRCDRDYQARGRTKSKFAAHAQMIGMLLSAGLYRGLHTNFGQSGTRFSDPVGSSLSRTD